MQDRINQVDETSCTATPNFGHSLARSARQKSAKTGLGKSRIATRKVAETLTGARRYYWF